MSRIENNESGVVSIFSVLFFIIFISIVTIGFMKIISDEQQQTVNNDLTASALAAANSGVEEAKRVLLFCQSTTNASEQASCASALNNSQCDAISGSTSITDALGIQTIGMDGIVSNNSAYEQRWTCLNIRTITKDIDDVAIANGQSEIIPLSATQQFDTLQVQWHAIASTKEGVPGGYPVAASPRHSQPEWASYYRYPAALRVEIISHPTSGVDLNSIDANTKTVVLFPSTTGAIPSTYPLATSDVRVPDPNLRTASLPLTVRCEPIDGDMPDYACRARLSFVGMPSTLPSANKYYARISALYANTHINLSLSQGGGTVDFDNVQPEVDVTGRANDVFRRISARLMFDTTAYLPNFAIESGQTFCKDMLVTNLPGTSETYCN